MVYSSNATNGLVSRWMRRSLRNVVTLLNTLCKTLWFVWPSELLYSITPWLVSVIRLSVSCEHSHRILHLGADMRNSRQWSDPLKKKRVSAGSETIRLRDGWRPGHFLSLFRTPVPWEASMAPGLLNPDVCSGWQTKRSVSFNISDWPEKNGSEVFIWPWCVERQT